MNRKKALLLIIPVLVLIGPVRGSLNAYQLGGCGQWTPPELHFKINPNISDSSAGTVDEQVLAHLTGAYDWNNESGTHFDFQYDDTTSIAGIYPDGVNVLYAVDLNGNGTLAATWCLYQDNRFSGFDIVYYDRDVKWSGPGDPDFNEGEVDIWSITAHEMGHAFGLGHSDVLLATMWPYYLFAMRYLDQDDIDGARARYPGQPDILVRMLPNDIRAIFGPSGGTWTFDATAENTTGSSHSVDIWFDVRMPAGGSYGPVLGPFTLQFSAGETRSATNISLQVPGIAPAGIYVVNMKVGTYPSLVDDESNVGFQKTATMGATVASNEAKGIHFDHAADAFRD